MTEPDSQGQDGAPAHTPLHDLHVAASGRMTPFAGYVLPVQYPTGILAEHAHVRAAAGLFDVSHMGQAWLTAGGDVCAALEKLVPGEIARLKPGRMRYTQLLNEDGGIIDDLMVTRFEGEGGAEMLFLVVNGARKSVDFAHISQKLGGEAELDVLPERALIALQGPEAAGVMSALLPDAGAMPFMSAMQVKLGGADIIVSRCGYTGEDGYEISVGAGDAAGLASRLLEAPAVKPIGLGARDSLRLEAGLCLYGNDIDETTSPVEADLVWSIGKRRREEGGFPGADRIMAELADGPKRRRVGIKPQGRAPARQGTPILAEDGREIGVVTSGLYGPTCEAPVAMGYVEASTADGAAVGLSVRGKALPAHIAAMPFVPHRYYRSRDK
ncbi:MAG: glycine cleavage system aminomethyltransferase GcvT [Geminicoccaceae bacterium]